MKQWMTAVCLTAALSLASPVAAQSEDELSKNAVDAAMSYMAGTLVCADVVGDSYILVGREMLEDMLRAHGDTGDSLIIHADDLEKHLRQQQAGRDVRSTIGTNGVTEADVRESCMQLLNTGLRATQVATARYRQSLKK